MSKTFKEIKILESTKDQRIKLFNSRFRLPNPDFNPSLNDNITETLDKCIFKTSTNAQNSLNNYEPLKSQVKWNVKRNIDRSTFIKLMRLKDDKDIVINPADKNLGLTILDTVWYIKEILKHLENTNNYINIDTLQTMESLNFQKDQLFRIFNRNQNLKNIRGDKLFISNRNLLLFLGKNLNYEFKQEPELETLLNTITCTFYILPKVHKPTLSSRPSCSSFLHLHTSLHLFCLFIEPADEK